MRNDPGRSLQEEVIIGMSVKARGAERLRLRDRGRLLAWQAADSNGPMSELERAEFLLRRLHPTLPEAALQQVIGQLAAAEEAGDWSGFERPEPLSVR